MLSVTEQRKAVRRLWYRSHLALDRAYADLPDAWESIVLRHAERQADGSLRITHYAKVLILAECERELAMAELKAVRVLVASVERAGELPGEAV